MCSGIARAVWVVVVCAALRPDALCMAADKDEADYAPGTLVVVDFGDKSVGEVVSKERSGWFKVRSVSRLGTERTQTLPPKYLSPAQPGAKYGERLDGKDRGAGKSEPKKETGDEAKGEAKRDFLNPAPRTHSPGMPPLNADTAPKSAAGDSLPDLKPGTLVELKGEFIVGEVIEKTPAGTYLVRVNMFGGREVKVPKFRQGLVEAKPGAKFGDKVENPLAPKPINAGPSAPNTAAPESLPDLKPGTLVEVKGEFRVGEVVEKTPDGTYLVRVKVLEDQEFDIPKPRRSLVEAKPGAKFGDQLENPFAPKSSLGDAIGAERPAAALEELRRMSDGGIGKFVEPGTLVIRSGRPVGRIVAEVPTQGYRVRYIGSNNAETEEVIAGEFLKLAGPNQPYGYDVETGEQKQIDAAATASKERKDRLAAARNAPVISQLLQPRSDAAEAIRPLIGSWRIVESSRSGRITASLGKETLIITPTLIHFPGVDGRIVNSVEFRVDPTQTPKQLEYQLQLSIPTAKRPEVWHGIYELQGDTLRICLGEVDMTSGRPGPRPTEFKTYPGMPGEYLLLKRVSQ